MARQTVFEPAVKSLALPMIVIGGWGRVAWCVVRGGEMIRRRFSLSRTQHATRNTHHASRFPRLRLRHQLQKRNNALSQFWRRKLQHLLVFDGVADVEFPGGEPPQRQ